MIAGKWTGTMNLTEPHCGTDLGLLRTKAIPGQDGSYRITGTKIFISAGEHDLADNIVHLVLARIEGAPAGTKGTSLFVVPKFLTGDGGSLGARNAVTCGSIEEKMGIHGNATCVLNFENAIGWLIGQENRGLQAMFVMMNEARMGVGVQGLAVSDVAYQNAAIYARERLQGRSISGPKFPDKPADPIIVHPDVRRALMTMKAFNEAGRALVMWTALRGDVAHRSGDEKERQAADDHMGLLTPVIKGVLTDQGFANTVIAQQVFGGHGYIAETGVEQFVRDSRIAMIYEGANGIQALDLVGRKLPKDGGRALQAFFAELQGFIKEHGEAEMKPYVEPLATALGHLQQSTMWFMQNAIGKPDNAGAGSHDYMHLLGLVALGYMWCRMALAAREKLAAGGDGRRSPAGKARHRPLLHGAHAAGKRRAPRAHPVGRRQHDGTAGRGVLDGSRSGGGFVRRQRCGPGANTTGGCQCGAVRYALLALPLEVSVCHCRMCQKASGGPIMAFCPRAQGTAALDARDPRCVPQFEPGRTPFLQRLRDAADLPFHRTAGHQRHRR